MRVSFCRAVTRCILTALILTAVFPDGVFARPYLLAYFKSHPVVGLASWYGHHEAGRRTASGALFDPNKLTAAHRTLPMGTCVQVTAMANGRSIEVPIIDRGPYVQGRIIDLSQSAAKELGFEKRGLTTVRIAFADCAGAMKGTQYNGL